MLNNMQRQEGLCSCDSACVVYDDCCWDFQQQCPELHERAVDIRNAFDVMPSSICFRMYVDTHPSGNKNVLFINSCEGTTCDHPNLTGVPEPHTQVPVQDLDTGIFYVNFNCAFCNGARRLQAIGVHLNYRNWYQDWGHCCVTNDLGSSPQPSGFALGLWWASQVVGDALGLWWASQVVGDATMTEMEVSISILSWWNKINYK